MFTGLGKSFKFQTKNAFKNMNNEKTEDSSKTLGSCTASATSFPDKYFRADWYIDDVQGLLKKIKKAGAEDRRDIGRRQQ